MKNYYQVAHNELVASAKAVKIGHEINPDFKIGCMMAMVPIYPYSCNPEDMMQLKKQCRNVSILQMFMSWCISKLCKKMWEEKD